MLVVGYFERQPLAHESGRCSAAVQTSQTDLPRKLFYRQKLFGGWRNLNPSLIIVLFSWGMNRVENCRTQTAGLMQRRVDFFRGN
jgi:hypothetical protein